MRLFQVIIVEKGKDSFGSHFCNYYICLASDHEDAVSQAINYSKSNNILAVRVQDCGNYTVMCVNSIPMSDQVLSGMMRSDVNEAGVLWKTF